MTVVPGRPHLSVFGLYQRSRVREENRVEAIVGSISAARSPAYQHLLIEPTYRLEFQSQTLDGFRVLFRAFQTQRVHKNRNGWRCILLVVSITSIRSVLLCVLTQKNYKASNLH